MTGTQLVHQSSLCEGDDLNTITESAITVVGAMTGALLESAITVCGAMTGALLESVITVCGVMTGALFLNQSSRSE